MRRNLKHYNLDAINSVGYRVNSRRGTRFRQWTNGLRREHLVRGYIDSFVERVALLPGPWAPH